MKKILFTLFIALPSFFFAQQGIIGGNQIPIEDAPYQVSLVDWTPSPPGASSPIALTCGGILVSDRWVLTAAHCLENTRNYQFPTYILKHNLEVDYGSDQTGPYNPDPNAGAQIPVKNIYIHPQYTPIFGGPSVPTNDIALIELVTPVDFDHKLIPVELANACNTIPSDVQESVSPNPPNSAFLTGWGRTSINSSSSTFLQGTSSNIISNTYANQLLTNNNVPLPNPSFNNDMINFYNGTSTSYSGDSGGPAVIDKNGNKINIGITSFSVKDKYVSPTDLPNTYTNVRNFENFIKNPAPGVFTNIIPTAPGIDLYTKDKPWDMGQEPFPTPFPYTSEDIWVRNTNDGIEIHQDPKYSMTGNNPNTVYVRVTNRGCTASNGSEELKVYWAKAATALAWPVNWNGSLNVNGNSLGGQIGTVTLPVIEPGDAYVAEVSWLPPNPLNFAGLNQSSNLIFRDEPHHFCLLTRIVNSPTDPIVNETADVGHNTVNNNNIAWKNLSVIDGGPGYISGPGVNDVPNGATVTVGGVGNSEEVYDFIFCDAPQAGETNLIDVAEVKITLDDQLWAQWESVDFQRENIEIVNMEMHQIMLTGNCGKIQGFSFEEYEQRLLHAGFNFLTDHIDAAHQFHFTVTQVTAEEQTFVGGELFEVNAELRESFNADAGEDLEIEEGDIAELNAASIGEDAIYKWYNGNGELIHTGENVAVSPDATTTYKLEVIATTDGFKDYDEVTVEIKKNKIISVSPNPAASFIDIVYKLKDVSAAHLMLVHNTNNTSIQFDLSVADENIQLNVEEFERGYYSLILVCDDVIEDHKNILLE